MPQARPGSWLSPGFVRLMCETRAVGQVFNLPNNFLRQVKNLPHVEVMPFFAFRLFFRLEH
jgi:hypothetical protein